MFCSCLHAVAGPGVLSFWCGQRWRAAAGGKVGEVCLRPGFFRRTWTLEARLSLYRSECLGAEGGKWK